MTAKNTVLKGSSVGSEIETIKRLDLVVKELDKISSRLDAISSLILDFLLSNQRYEKPVAYTDKVERLGELGFEIDEISGIVRRPSNYVSSRLRESKKRKFSKRQRKVARAAIAKE